MTNSFDHAFLCSNYFRVVDIEKFLENFPDYFITSVRDDGSICLYAKDEEWKPLYPRIFIEETDECYDFTDYIKSHLLPGSWCVLHEVCAGVAGRTGGVGAPRILTPYITGHSTAFTKDCEIGIDRQVTLHDIYESLPPGVSQCGYPRLGG